MKTSIMKTVVVILTLIIVGCGGESKEIALQSPVSQAPAIIQPDYSRIQNPNSLSARQVFTANTLNSSGSFSHPFANESFDGNILLSVDVSDPDGLQAVAISFNESSSLLYLCNSENPCNGNSFHKSKSGINPADFGITQGPITLGLWVLDNAGFQQQVSSVTINWQFRKIVGLDISRDNSNNSLIASWEQNNSLLKYNLYLAASSGVNQKNYTELTDGQGIIAIDAPPQSFTNLDANTSYFLLITGVDSSGESAFSSEVRMDPPSGQTNDKPVAATDTISGNEDTTISGNVLANDSDPNSNPIYLNTRLVKEPRVGQVQLNSDGSFQYQAPQNYNGQDSFIYEIQDGQGGFSEGTVQLQIVAVNDNPVAIDDSYSATVNKVLNIAAPGVLANDTDIDGDNLALPLSTNIQTTNGSVLINTDGSFSYTPNTDFEGTDSFSYQVSDGNGGLDTATVTIFVGNQNNPPIAVNDNYTTDENTTLFVDGNPHAGILANDSDPDGDSIQLSSALVENVANGNLQIDSQGFFTYIPNANFTGSDSFIYQIEDGRGGTAQATVTINVTATNHPPVAEDDTLTLDEDTTATIDVLVNDSDPDGDSLDIIDAQAQHGSVNILTGGQIDYTPNDNYNGSDQIDYTIYDNNGLSASAIVVVTINPVNDAPIANNDTATTSLGVTISINVLANDSDVDGDTLTVSSVSSSFGTVSINNDNTIQFSESQTTGDAIIDYTVEDGNGGTASAQVTVTVIGSGNQNPIAVDDSATVQAGSSIIIDVLANDSDADGDTLTVSGFSGGQGTISLNSDNTFTYIANATGVLSDSFDYDISDGNGGTATATVFITITSVNNAPTANDDTATTYSGGLINIDVVANDTDPEGDSLTISSVSGAKGNVTINTNSNILEYTAPSDGTTTDTFTYTINDGNGNTANGKVTVTINQPPVAGDDSYTVQQGATLTADGQANATLIANDSDPENDTLTISTTPISAPSHGTLTLQSNGSFTFIANASYVGSDSFVYQLNDSAGNSANGTVNITITASNNRPYANPDTYSLRPNTSISVNAAGNNALPLANDTDPDNDTISYANIISSVQNGSITDATDSSFDYIPNSNFTGVDSYLYEITDNNNATGRTLVALKVTESSPDNSYTLPNIPNTDFYALAYANAHYYLVGDRTILYSTDGANWDPDYIDNATVFTGVAAGNTTLTPNIISAVAVGASGSVMVLHHTHSSSTWVKRSITTQGKLTNVRLFDGEFIATGLGEVLFSLDGVEWTTSATVSRNQFNDVIKTSAGGLIAVGNSGVIETSNSTVGSSAGNQNTSIVTWTSRTSGTSENLHAIASNGSIYVAVGDNDTILTSSDGIVWNKITLSLATNFNNVIYANNLFMIVGNNSTIITSSDGTNWTQQFGIDAPNLFALAHDGSNFITASVGGQLFNTQDGVNYLPVTTGDRANYTGVALKPASTGSPLVVRAGKASHFFSSLNGTTWTENQTTGFLDINHVDYLNGGFIAVGDLGIIYTSNDGLTWTQRTSGVTTNLNDVEFFTGIDSQTQQTVNLYVIVGDAGTFLVSNDAINWTQESPDTGVNVNENLYGIAHDNDYFVAVGQNGRILVRNNTGTPGGTTWMDFFSNSQLGQLNDIFYDGTTNIIVGNNGMVVTGTAMGGVFTQQTTSFTDNLNSVAGRNGDYVAVGDNGAIFSSSDGKTWLPAIRGTKDHLRFVVIDNKIYYAVGDNGTVIVGNDHY